MACGTPVVASNVWGTPEVVAAPDAGVLMDERTPRRRWPTPSRAARQLSRPRGHAPLRRRLQLGRHHPGPDRPVPLDLAGKASMKILYHHRTRSKDGQYVHIEEMIRRAAPARPRGHHRGAAERRDRIVRFGRRPGRLAQAPSAEKFYELMELAYSLVAYRRLAQGGQATPPGRACMNATTCSCRPASGWRASTSCRCCWK